MFCPLVFREGSPALLHGAIRAHPLATLITHGASGLSANLLPFTLTPDGELLRAHLSRANTQLADLKTASEALVIFQGPQAYVTPSWYPAKREHGRVVPTWNYIMVQVRGRPRILEDAAWLRAQIEALTAQQEDTRPQPWSIGDAPAGFIQSQIKGIVGLEIPVARIEGKWKTSQNQTPANRQGVMDGLAACGMSFG